MQAMKATISAYLGNERQEVERKRFAGWLFRRFEGLQQCALDRARQVHTGRAIDQDNALVFDDRERIVGGLGGRVAHFFDLNDPLAAPVYLGGFEHQHSRRKELLHTAGAPAASD